MDGGATALLWVLQHLPRRTLARPQPSPLRPVELSGPQGAPNRGATFSPPQTAGIGTDSDLSVNLRLSCAFGFLTCNFTGWYWEFSLKDPFSSWQFSVSHSRVLQIEFWFWPMYFCTCPSTLRANAVNL